MQYRLFFLPNVKSDIELAAIYYDEKLAGLGKRFKKAVKQQLLVIKGNPLTKSIRYSDVRLAVVDKFPYSSYYTISGNMVIFLAVICDYRNPTEY